MRVLVADDHEIYRAGIAAMVSSRAPDITIVGEAADGKSAVEFAQQRDVDVVLMDVRMPGGGGILATRDIVRLRPGTSVLMLTMFDDDALFDALRAGARGYILKNATVDEIIDAIRCVARGEVIFSAGAAERLLTFVTASAANARPFPQLTDREHDILRLIARGDDPHRIARTLDLTVKTVCNYIASILTKLQVRDREAAAARAREVGL
ncbi:MAG: hypothetical protein BGO26_15285 [Actinobacteria bacterium 69-20]|nr:MAG: hypothetical protein BGO26_15285 [Actinobacteria bacterium 69-20]